MGTNLAEFYRGVEAAAAVGQSLAAAARASAVHDAVAPLLVGVGSRACREGCAHCCHFPVGVTYPEVLALRAALADDACLRARVLEDARASASLGWGELVGRACPLLKDGRCAVYDARPLPCRALASRDDSACARALRGEGEAPRDELAYWRGLGAASVLAAAHPAGSRELRSALAAVLEAHEPHAAFAAARPAGA